MDFFKQYGWIVIAVVAFFLIVIIALSYVYAQKISKQKDKDKRAQVLAAQNSAPEKKVEEKKEVEAKVEETESVEGAYSVSFDADSKVWKLKKEGGKRAIKNFATKAEALEYAKTLSKKDGETQN